MPTYEYTVEQNSFRLKVSYSDTGLARLIIDIEAYLDIGLLLQPAIGGSDIRLSPISFIMDIGAEQARKAQS
jgi:hypothetical protein